MRIFHILPTGVSESAELDALTRAGLPEQGFVWVACARANSRPCGATLQGSMLQALAACSWWNCTSDLMNSQLPSHYDYTSVRPAGVSSVCCRQPPRPLSGTAPAPASTSSGPPILRRIDTSPVGFAVFDRVLLTVHPTDCAARDTYADQAAASQPCRTPAGGARLPASPADLMLRIINHMVDGFLELRRELTHQLDHWQTELIDPKPASTTGALLQAGWRCTRLMKSAKTSAPPSRTGLKPSRPGLKPALRRDAVIATCCSARARRAGAHRTGRAPRTPPGAKRETAVQLHFSVQATAPTTSCAR